MPAESRCGSCNLCCKLVAVPELDKPRGEWCQHCAIGVGCKIYETRPQVCRGYPCQWNINHAWPDELQPSRCKVVFEALRLSRTCLALVDPGRPDAWKAPVVMDMIGKLLRAGVAIVVSCDGHKPNVLLPEGRPAKQVWQDLLNEQHASEAA